MGRLKVGNDVMKVRFADGTFARIDKECGNRNGFIRAAVDAALNSISGLDAQIQIAGVEPNDILQDMPMRPATEKGYKYVAETSLPAAKKNSLLGSVSKDPLSLRDQDKADVLAAVAGGRFSSSDLERRMGWLGLRYSRAEKDLLSSGDICIADGVLVSCI